MSRFTAPMIQCDGEDGFCGAQTIDHYLAGAVRADGWYIRESQRAPGWVNKEDEDLCPDCAKKERTDL